MRARGSGGDPIPTGWKALDNAGIVFRRGQLVLIAAGPGTAKSALTLALTIQSGVPGMIFSADSDAFTQMTRAISMITGLPLAKTTEMVLEDTIPAEIVEQLTSVPLRIDYESSPSSDDIEEILEAYWELFGEYPTLIVIDNITNVEGVGGEDTDYSAGLEGLMDYLHGMARETAACVIGLHHVKGEYNNGDKPIPLNGIKGQIGRVPEMILTLHKRPMDDQTSILCISKVKVRGGQPDPTGMTWAELEFIGNKMSFKDVELQEVAPPEQQWEDDQRRQQEELEWSG